VSFDSNIIKSLNVRL